MEAANVVAVMQNIDGDGVSVDTLRNFCSFMSCQQTEPGLAIIFIRNVKSVDITKLMLCRTFGG